MNKDKAYYGSLLAKFFSNELPAEQLDELLDWMRDDPAAYGEILDSPEKQGQLMSYASSMDLPEALSRQMQDRLIHAMAAARTKENHSAGVVRPVALWRNGWWRYAAAAVLILGMAYLWNSRQTNTAVVQPHTPVSKQSDILPGSDKAVLTLSNGQTVSLNAAVEQTIIDGKQSINNSNGLLTYASSDVAVYNTISTPKGGQYRLLLPDGTNVWLNAASSITFPTAFPGKERLVKITGEVYFEVKKDPSRKFIVSAGEMRTEVLGTHFTINSYSDEEQITATLLEGSIRVIHKEESALLQPGAQAAVGQRGGIRTIRDANVEEAIGWIKGYFYFEKANVQTVMRQLGRWYDIDVKYTGKVTRELFVGKIQRNLHLSEVMDILKTIGVEYTVKGKTLIIGS